MNEAYAVIDLLGAVPGYFFAIVIGFRASKDKGSRLLSLGLLAYSSFLLSLFFHRLGYLDYSGVNHLQMNIFVHISWPIFYLYLNEITSETKSFSQKQLLHFIPFVLYATAVLVQSMFFDDIPQIFYVSAMVFTAVIVVGYSVATFIILALYRKRAALFPSEMTRLKLHWITTNIVLWFVLVGVQIVFFLLRTTDVEIPEVAGIVHGLFINIATVSWVYVIGYFAISHPRVLQTSQTDREDSPSNATPVAETPEPTVRPSTVHQDEEDLNIDTSQVQEIVSRLQRVMEQQRPYLDNQLTLAKLAKSINRPSYLVGRIINKQLGKNFLTYVNEHRAEEVKRMLVSESCRDERILDIAFECGFRTKSSFNAFFKKYTGETPSDYRRHHSEQKSHWAQNGKSAVGSDLDP